MGALKRISIALIVGAALVGIAGIVMRLLAALR